MGEFDLAPDRMTVINGRNNRYLKEDVPGWLSIKSVRCGQAHYTFAGSRALIHTGVYLILNHQQHYTIRIEAVERVETFCVFFPLDYARDVVRGLTLPDVRLLDAPDVSGGAVDFFERLQGQDDYVSPLLDHLYAAKQTGRDDTAYRAEFARDMLAAMLHVQGGIYAEAEKLPPARAATRIELYRRLHLARNTLHAAYAESLTLDDLAAVAAMSPYHFLRAFKSAFGATPRMYQRQLRIERARDLLARTNTPVTEICYRVGFQSLGSFSSLFSRETGLSPRAYRQAARR